MSYSKFRTLTQRLHSRHLVPFFGTYPSAYIYGQRQRHFRAFTRTVLALHLAIGPLCPVRRLY